MNMDKDAEAVLDFVNKERGSMWWTKKKLSLDTRLREDLGIEGDDAYDFFVAFEERFQVNLENLSLGKYFGPEGCGPEWVFKLSMWLQGKKVTIIKDKTVLTVNDLVQAVKAGKWLDP